MLHCSAGKDIVYVSELKYLGICVSAAKLVQFSVEHLRLKFYRMFNCIYSKSKAANCEVVIIFFYSRACIRICLLVF